jgi:ribA/ribD-fused uncharacterized protein
VKIRSKQDLISCLNAGNKVKYVFFWGHQKPTVGVTKSCFSQWYESPFEANGNSFQTAEHFMMYEKAMLFGDNIAAERILATSNPGEAKAIGREVIGFEQPAWEAQRFEIVVSANVAKFGGAPELKEFLLKTGNRVLVEASPVDRIWGIGLAVDDSLCENPNKWKGENLLGFALMEARDLLVQ